MLRGVAATLVMLCHFCWTFSQAYSEPSTIQIYMAVYGAIGVDLFFVISGFVIFYAWFSRDFGSTRVSDFLRRRVARILPLYWIALLATVVMYALGYRSGDNLTLNSMILDIFLIPHTVYDSAVGVSWTLTFEFIFYLIFCATLFLRSQTSSLAFTTVALGVLAVAGQAIPALAVNDIPVVVEFTFGMVLAHLVLKGRRLKTSGFLLVSMFLVTLAPVLFLPDLFNSVAISPWARVIFWGVPSAVVVGSMLQVPDTQKIPQKICMLLGGASYSLYLFHYFFVYVAEMAIRILAPTGFQILLLEIFIIAVTLVFSIAVYLALDLPIQRYFSSRVRRQALAFRGG